MNYKDILAMASAYKQVAEASACKTTKKEAMDPVDAKELKGKHKDRKDKDIDNDGDVDKSDEYLHKRRKAVSASIKGKQTETEVQEATELDEKLDHKELKSDLNNRDAKVHKVSTTHKAEADVIGHHSFDTEKGKVPILKRFDRGQHKKKTVTIKKGQKLVHEPDDGDYYGYSKKHGHFRVPSYNMNKDHLKEEVELDEISKKTLGSYVKKASKSASDNARTMRSSETDHHTYRATADKYVKRIKGISKANDKLTKESKDHGNMNNGSPRGEGLSPSAKKELDRTTPMNPATDELAVNNLNFKTFKAMAKKAPMRSNDNAQGDKTPPKAGK